ncbi:MAG: hypothetical protein Q8O43_06920 [Dehalococcoidia bacterium]|nr:hypothetical protein [Dehalococcoidia bacterium]
MGVILERSEESQSGGIRQRLPTTRFFVVPMLSGLLQNDRPIVLRQAPKGRPYVVDHQNVSLYSMRGA